MKKLILAASVLAVFSTPVFSATCVTPSGEAIYAEWTDDPGICWPLVTTGTETCAQKGGWCTMYTGGTNTGSCSGKNKYSGTATEFTGIQYWCRWESSCWMIDTPQTDDCDTKGYVYTDVPPSGESTSEDDGKQCEGGTWAGIGKGNPNQSGAYGYCNWGDCVFDPSDDYACLSGGCFEIMNETEDGDCNNKLTSKAQCPTASLPKANQGGTPIMRIPQTAALTVSTFGRSLHIYSPQKGATVSMFDLSGAKVHSGKVNAGNSVFSLERMAPGVYYAVVQAGSSSQRIQVLLK